MKRFFAFFAIMMLFAIPAIAEDQDKVNLGSNLSFSFEPMVAKSLTIIPFPTPTLNVIQERTDKNFTTPTIVLLLVCLFAASVTAISS